jgi:hypothetical protein
MKINWSIALKAGLIGAAAGLVIGLLSRIPFLGCLIAPLGWVASTGAGVLYAYFSMQGGAKLEITDGAIGGAASGAIAGIVAPLVSGLLDLIFSHGSFFSMLGSAVVGIIVGAVLGAVGGLVFVLIKGKK